MMLRNLQISFQRLITTKAFKEADTKWPFESWDDREWARVQKEALKEIKNGFAGQ